MGRVFRIKTRMRRFTRRHPWLTAAVRSSMVFSAAFGGAYGFISGSRSEDSGYDPHAFAIGARFLFESQGDLIVLRDTDGCMTFVNDAYCELAGQPRSALVGSHFTLDVLEQGEAAIETNGTRIHDQRVATALGPRWIAWREGLVRSDAGQPAEMQCVGRDVTDRTETERALAEARDQADAANRA